jgi:hypothetical protein
MGETVSTISKLGERQYAKQIQVLKEEADLNLRKIS